MLRLSSRIKSFAQIAGRLEKQNLPFRNPSPIVSPLDYPEPIGLFEPVGLSVPAEPFGCIDQHKSEDYSTTQMEDNASNGFGIDTP